MFELEITLLESSKSRTIVNEYVKIIGKINVQNI